MALADAVQLAVICVHDVPEPAVDTGAAGAAAFTVIVIGYPTLEHTGKNVPTLNVAL